VTGRPALTLAPPPDPAGPRERGLGYRLWRAWELLDTARWRTLSAVLAAVATAGMRERAWAEGFAVALGSPARSWLDHLDEWQAGNEAGHELRYQTGTMAAAMKPPRFGTFKPWDRRSAALAESIVGLLGENPERPRPRFPLVAVTLPAAATLAPLAALSDGAVRFAPPGGTFPTARSDTWPPLVAPRPMVASAGRHVAPGGTAGPPAACPGWTAPRHRRPSPVRLAGRWLREVLGWRDVAPGRHGRTGDLSAAA
jgi:hypothetical protein